MMSSIRPACEGQSDDKGVEPMRLRIILAVSVVLILAGGIGGICWITAKPAMSWEDRFQQLAEQEKQRHAEEKERQRIAEFVLPESERNALIATRQEEEEREKQIKQEQQEQQKIWKQDAKRYF